MATIKAIETEYKDHLFRSRLEARWAVFLDGLGIKWDYEQEGYEVATGVWYLPDFRLEDSYLEIKPNFKDANEADSKMKLLVSGSRVPGIVVYGDPLDHTGVLYQPSTNYGVVRSFANFQELKGAIEAGRAARQARFDKRGNSNAKRHASRGVKPVVTPSIRP